MMKIYKYPFPIAPKVYISMPRGANILTVQVQGGKPCIWAIVDTDNPEESREFNIVGTGDPLGLDPERYRYIGTFQLNDGYVWHLFRPTVCNRKFSPEI